MTNRAVTEEYAVGKGMAEYGSGKWRASVTPEVGNKRNKQEQGKGTNDLDGTAVRGKEETRFRKNTRILSV